ncbi:glutathione S-transferase T3-like protein [Tanacetum coccineum]
MLTSKWHTLNANCQKFNAAYKRAKRLGKSGENDVDFLKRAQSIYRDEHKGVSFSQEDAWAILRFHPKWDAPEQVDLTGDVPGATQEDLFGHDARPRPAGKPRPAKKTKSDATASTGGSSASTQFGELMEQELRLKREAAERAFEAQAEKDRTLMRLEELRFLATSTKDLDDDDAYWINKQKQKESLLTLKTCCILPDAVQSYTLSPTDGSFTVMLTKPCYVKFDDQTVYYDKTIKGKLTYGSVSNVSGIQAKELFVWLSVTGMDLDVGGDMVEFHVGVLSKKLPVDMFRDVPECKSKACVHDGFSRSI